jgi:hypothetical protein
VYIFIGLFDITLPFYNWIGDSALSFSIRKESGTTKLNAIPYFCFVFFLRKKNGERDENDEGELFYGLAL